MRGNNRNLSFVGRMHGFRSFSTNQGSFTELLQDCEEDVVLETQGLDNVSHPNILPATALPQGQPDTQDATSLPQGQRAPQAVERRQYATTHWTAHELMVLQAAKKDDEEKRLFGGTREKHKRKDVRWSEIEDFCWQHDVRRSAKACLAKWETLSQDFKKIHDYMKEIPSGRDSYWQMTSSEHKDVGLPLSFFSDVYEAMDCWYSKKTDVNPIGLVTESSIPASFSTPLSRPEFTQEVEDEQDSPTPPADGGDIQGDSSVVQPDYSTGKKRQRVPRGTDGLVSMLQKSEQSQAEWRERQAEFQNAFKKQSLEIAANTASALQAIATGFLQLVQNTKSTT